jgi:hypothetical protein
MGVRPCHVAAALALFQCGAMSGCASAVQRAPGASIHSQGEASLGERRVRGHGLRERDAKTIESSESSQAEWPPQDWRRWFRSIPPDSGAGKLELIAAAVQASPIDPELMPEGVIPAGEYFRWDFRDSSEEGFSSPERKPLTPAQEMALNFRSRDTYSKIRVRTERLGSFNDDRAFLEALVPQTRFAWKTELWPISRSVPRYLRKTTIFQPHTVVETFDTVIAPMAVLTTEKLRARFPQTELSSRDLARVRIHASAQIAHSQEVHRDAIEEILAFVLPDYPSRRGWSESFVRDLYRHAIEKRLSTRYTMIRERGADGRVGAPLAALGADYASYGAIRYFDRTRQAWMLSFNTFSPDRLHGRYLGIRGPKFRTHIEKSLEWSGAIPALGLEKDSRLPRPLVAVARIKAAQLTEADQEILKDSLPAGLDPDFSQGVTFYEGRIGEPTKLKVVPRTEMSKAAHFEVWSNIGESLLPTHQWSKLNSKGQAWYIYNPAREGSLLYRGMFKPRPDLAPVKVDGEDWEVFSTSPSELSDGAGLSTEALRTLFQEKVERFVFRGSRSER